MQIRAIGALALQKVNYKYNIRGWLTAINDVNNLMPSATDRDLFAFKINYNKKEDDTAGLFNGNISETLWRTSADNTKRKYAYNYDNLNRLLEANYSKPEDQNTLNNYLEKLSYDKAGNILTLERNGNLDPSGGTPVNQIDNLEYSYHPDNKNQLLKVNDLSNSPQGFKDNYTSNENDFSYDNNGNMTADVNKEIESITYNHLNLPIKINFGAKGNIYYLYNAIGGKVKKVVEDNVAHITTTTDYLSGFQYLNTELQFFPHAEGYVHYTKPLAAQGGENSALGSFNYVFNYTDHLGNIRVSYSKDPSTNVLKILEENHYYPFGLKHTNYNSDKLMYIKEADVYRIRPVAPVLQTYKYKYNGKELQEELGLNMYDYGARNYDPALGRWMNIDPLAEQYRKWSPYTYCINSPLRFVDPDGMRVANFGIDPPGSASNPHGIQNVDVGNKYHTKEEGQVAKINSAVMTAENNSSNSVLNAIGDFVGTFMFGVDSSSTNRYEGVANTGRYSPGNSGLVPLALLASPLIIAEAGVAATAVTLESAISGIAINTLSQGIANGGDLTKVNTVEALSSALPGIGPAIVGESFNLPVGQIMQGNFMPSAPTSFEKGMLQIGGGLMSNKFGNKIDANPIFGQGVAKTYGEMAKFGVETGTNVLPLLGN